MVMSSANYFTTSQHGTNPLPSDGSDLCMKLLDIFFASVSVYMRVCTYFLIVTYVPENALF